MKSNYKNNCISNEIMQMYIDKELPVESAKLVEQHLKVCKSCNQRFENQIIFIESLKNSLPSIHENEIIIPAFNIENKSKKSTLLNLANQWRWAAAAILIFGLFVIFQKSFKQRQVKTQYLIYDSQKEIDANKPWHEQEIEIYFIEQKKIIRKNK